MNLIKNNAKIRMQIRQNRKKDLEKVCSYLTIYGEVLAAGEAMGFEWDELNDLLEKSDGASPMLFDKGTTHRQRIFCSETALTSTAMKDLGLALICAQKSSFALPLTAVICQYDRFMHFSPKYKDHSTFGTIGVLEDIFCKGPGDYETISEDKKSAMSDALIKTLIGTTSVLAHEAVLFCSKAGIDEKLSSECLRTCHGATVYFKDQKDNITLAAF